MSAAEAKAIISRLRSEIFEVDAVISRLYEEEGSEASELQLRLEENEAAYEAALAAVHRQIAEELEADVILTNHYKDTANSTCVSAMMDQQDEIIVKEHEAYKHSLLVSADSELTRRQGVEERRHEEKKQQMLRDVEVKKITQDHTHSNMYLFAFYT